MKTLKITLLLTLFILLNSCSKEDDSSNNSSPNGTYLTINGDTREIIDNGDSELTITKEILFNPPWYGNIKEDYEVINLRIYDPNKSLISKFGGYTYGQYLILRFVLPVNFSSGTYTTLQYKSSALSTNESYSEFLALTAFVKEIENDMSYEITEDNDNWIVEFEDLKYEGDNNTATISGRIIINK